MSTERLVTLPIDAQESAKPFFSKEKKNDAELEKAIGQIWDIARGFGLDPYPTHFEVVPPSIMYEFGAYGLPGRFSHWTHGKAYHQMKTIYDYGLSKIYELVINTNPAYGFLMDGNSLLQNKLVAAHVLAHVDFFKNNAYFEKTNRQMVDMAGLHADRLKRYEFEHGRHKVESTLDHALVIGSYFTEDYNRPGSAQEYIDEDRKKFEQAKKQPDRPKTPYDDLFGLDDLGKKEEPKVEEKAPFPCQPEPDILDFLAKFGNLEDWQRDIVQIVRQEGMYFAPQMKTKVMNEGWASYWHVRIMRELDLTDSESVEFANMHSSVVAPSQTSLNPYYVGMKMFEDIERRWDDPTPEEQERFGRKKGEGRKKIFEVRETESDQSFVRNYLTKGLVEDLDLYIYKREGDQLKRLDYNWEQIRDMIVDSMTNFGNPTINVARGGGNFERRGELLLEHDWDGREIDFAWAEKTLSHIFSLWGRPVNLITQRENKKVMMTNNGPMTITKML